jgi:geranylgeranyl reductase family protein
MAAALDVVVVGAGPAGAWAGWRLARAGVRVCIVDGSHPREKPCGGGITSRALELVSAAIPRGAVPAVPIAAARFVDGTGKSVAVRLPSDDTSAALLVANRETFDAALLDAARQAGAELIPARVTAVAPEAASGVRVRLSTGATLDAGFLFGADGANSLVRRSLMRPFDRSQLSIATGFFAYGTSSREIVLELLAQPPGYIWSFPRPDHLAIGICAQADAGVTAQTLRDRVKSWMERTGLARGARLVPYSWPIPSLAAPHLRALAPAGARWMLVGDAAGLVDPITREGIFFALQSAQLAADAFISPSRAGAGADYTARLRREVCSELALAASFKASFFRPRFSRALLEGIATSAAIRQILAELISGTQPYRGLKWRLARTMEIRLALRAFGMVA